MSGHSKWHSIKHKKGKEDAKRGQLFSKLSHRITIAAREGGGSPESNATLANEIETARKYSMPMDNIKRAIAKGTGELGGGQLEHMLFEGYGAGGVAIIADVLTDNRNRAAADVRKVFTRAGARVGESGSVAWMFERRAVVLVPADGVDEDELMLAAADGGADDVSGDGSSFEVTSAPEALRSVREAIETAGFPIESAELTMLPKTTVELTEESAARTLVKLVEALEELDDVQEVYANFDISEQLLEAVTS